jgi:hypothetical protein
MIKYSWALSEKKRFTLRFGIAECRHDRWCTTLFDSYIVLKQFGTRTSEEIRMLCSREVAARIREFESTHSDEKQPHHDEVIKSRKNTLFIYSFFFVLLLVWSQVMYFLQNSVLFFTRRWMKTFRYMSINCIFSPAVVQHVIFSFPHE